MIALESHSIRDRSIALIAFDRPDKRNALTPEMLVDLTAIVAGQMEPYAEGAWIGEIADGRFTSTAVSKDDKNLVQAFDLANPPRVPEQILQGLDRIQSTLSEVPHRAAVAA